MKKLVVLLLASLVATSAFAVIDPDPNGIGIYFDVTADINCTEQGTSIPFWAYVVLTNTTAPSISGYEVSYEFTGAAPGTVFRLNSLIANGEVSGLDLGDSSNPLMGFHIVGLASPLIAGEATVLHAWQLMLLAPSTLEMWIGSAPQSSIEGPFPVILNADDNTLFQAYQSTGLDEQGMPYLPVATINGDCVVGVEDVSFGSVKSLFR